MISFFVRYIKW